MRALKKWEAAWSENQVQPKVTIHERLNEASLQIKNIFQEDIRKAGKIQLEMVEVIKAEVAPVIAEAAKIPHMKEMQANKESL